MEKEIISRIIRSFKPEARGEEYPAFTDKRYDPFKISRENFHEIKKTDSNNKLAFIDGGNAEIMGSAGFSLHLVRIYYVIYEKNRRVKAERKEFYALASAINKGGDICYSAEIFPDGAIDISKSDITFSSMDPTITEGINRIKISKIGEIVRRLAELKTASELINKLDEGDIIVRDGSLQSSVTNESKYFEELYRKAEKKGVIVVGLSKTSNLLTDKGNSLCTAVRKIGPKGRWFYSPVADIDHPDHKAEMFVIKLNEASNYVFRFEVYKKQKNNINRILSALAENSNDIAFAGYPYGLVESDKFARVDDNEKRQLRVKFMANAGKEWEKIEEDEAAIDAHGKII